MFLIFNLLFLTIVSLTRGEEGVPGVFPDFPEVVHPDSIQIGIAADAGEVVGNSKFLRDSLVLRDSDDYLSSKEKFIEELLKRYGVKGDGFDQEWRKSFETTDEYKEKILPYLTPDKEIGASLEGSVSRHYCYKPVPYGISNCCKQCGTYGVLVNKGKLDPATPCAPPQTWYKCSSTGCFGKPTGTCKCEKTSNTGYAAILYDLTKNSLFFAESDLATPLCVKCGDSQQNDAHFRQFMNSKLLLEECPPCGVPKRVTVGCAPFASCPLGYVKVQDLSKKYCWFNTKKYICETPFC